MSEQELQEVPELKVIKSTEPRVEMGEESLTFVHANGERHQIKLVDVLEDGTPDQALAYGQLALMNAMIRQQQETAGALVQLAEAIRSIGPPKVEMPDPEKHVAGAMNAALKALKDAGITLPLTPEAIRNGNRS